MQSTFEDNYNHIRSGGVGFYEQPRGLVSVHGKEAVPFLDGMITNDMKTLEDGAQMFAAFPNAQGRLLALVRVLRQGDRFLIETEEATHEKLFNNLFPFTYAGDFFVEDISGEYRFYDLFGLMPAPPPAFGTVLSRVEPIDERGIYRFFGQARTETFAIKHNVGPLKADLIEITDRLYETLRVENGIPKYGVDMDDTTIVPELGLEGLISYNKGCYIGQEIIARIHFRGHVAKRLTGLFLDREIGSEGHAENEPLGSPPYIRSEAGDGMGGSFVGAELATADGKNAGRVTSATYSPKLGKTIALAYVRYDYLAEGTELMLNGAPVTVTNLPFFQ